MPAVAIQHTIKDAQKQGVPLVWSAENKRKIKSILKRYPDDRKQSATIPLLYLAQRQNGGWVSVEAMQLVAETLEMPYIRVYEVATFYTMFNLKPVGKYHVQVCTNCSCLIRGSDAVVEAVKEFTGIAQNKGTSKDGLFTFEEVECLGACVDAPMAQIGTHYYTNLDGEKMAAILKDLKAGKQPTVDTPPSEIDPVAFCGEAPKAAAKKAPAKKGAKK